MAYGAGVAIKDWTRLPLEARPLAFERRFTSAPPVHLHGLDRRLDRIVRNLPQYRQ